VIGSYAFPTIGGLAADLRSRHVSAREIARTMLERLERSGPPLNAIAMLTADRAIADAGRADRRLARGRASPLTGIPYGAKDLIAAAGCGDVGYGGDAEVVARLGRAGAVLTAKLAVENAGGGWSKLAAMALAGEDGPRAGPRDYGRNPWDPARWSGGSSSGSAIAVAAGLLPFSLGAETSGSVVGPAALCGLTALRPTYGAVSAAGVMPEAHSMDKVGIFAWTADDCALVYRAIAPRFRPRGHGDATVLADVRLGFAEEDFMGAFAAALSELGALIAHRARAVIPALPYGALVNVVLGCEGATDHAAVIASDRLERLMRPRQLAGLRAALTTTAREYIEAMRAREVIREEFERLFRSVDVIVAPTQRRVAPLLAELDAPRRTDAEAIGGNAALTAAANLAGLPGVTVPCGTGEGGLPIGIQLVGPHSSEPLLLTIAAAFQRATAHHERRPPVRSSPS